MGSTENQAEQPADQPSTSGSGTADPRVAQLLAQFSQNAQVDQRRQIKSKYAFWETQPVAQFNQQQEAQVVEGPLEPVRTVADVRTEPLTLPESFEWSVCDFTNPDVVHEVYELLSNNYVEDDDQMFRFNYSPTFLRWCLQPPGYEPDWLLGVRVKTNKKLVGFISGIPAHVRVNDNTLMMAEINFLCVHKKLRSKRLAPVLIKEITRRVNLRNIWQAVYTAGVLIPKPVATCRYWHRSLNPKKLIEIGFSRLGPRMTMARTIKLHKLPDQPDTPNLRPIELRDGPSILSLLNAYLAKYKLTQVFTLEEVRHFFQNIDNVICTYVVEQPDGRVTDLVSFYSLPSAVLNHPQHTDFRAAYCYYLVPTTVPYKQLLNDALILAKNKGYDVFNALDLLENNDDLLKELKFGVGDGSLHYYLYNWALPQALQPPDVGLILM